MKIEFLDGCTYSMEVDGTEFVDLSTEKQREVCHKLIDKVSPDILQRFMEYACEELGEDEDLGYCEECGSYNDKYIVNI